jgi:hypothetical protein
MQNTTPRLLALDTAIRFLGQRYVWGGDDPINGFDCSGFVIEILKSVGKLPRDGDWTADQLFRDRFALRPRFKTPGELKPGMLVFWAGASGKMRHIEMVWAIADTPITIGASGGGSATTTEAAAIKSNAYVKLRPVGINWAAALDPF